MESHNQRTINQLRDLIQAHAEGEIDAETYQPGAVHEEQDWVEKGREIALRQLDFCARSSYELQQAMVNKGVPQQAAQEVIERLTRVGLIDDEEYAKMLVRTRHLERGLARRALKVELDRKGIAPDLAEQALSQIDEDDELHAARSIVAKRVGNMQNVEPKRRRQRLYAALARRGFSSGTARGAIDGVLSEEGLPLY